MQQCLYCKLHEQKTILLFICLFIFFLKKKGSSSLTFAVIMSKNSFMIVSWLLILLLNEINCQMVPYKRARHTATLIDDKLYVLGGVAFDNSSSDEVVGKQFFFLDVSGSFNTQELLWNDLTSINEVPYHAKATSVRGGVNN